VAVAFARPAIRTALAWFMRAFAALVFASFFLALVMRAARAADMSFGILLGVLVAVFEERTAREGVS
jgi:hypothetical protein